jgi:uncharacterized protein
MESVHAFAARLAEAKRGGMILVSSDAAFGGVSRLAVYSATKAFGLNLGESLWRELRSQGVDVLSLVIGATDTPFVRKVLQEHSIPAETLALSVPSEVVPAALEHLGNGPTLVYGFSDDVADTTQSATKRRERVLRNGDFVSLFFGPEA